MWRPLPCLALILTLAFSPAVPAPLCLAAPDPFDPGGQGEGDQVTLEQFQEGQNQDQQDQEFRQALSNALESQGLVGTSLDQAPSYTRVIEEGQPFSATWRPDNTAAVPVPMTLLTVFTRVASNRSIEIYRGAVVPPGGAEVVVEITAQELQGRGIGVGQYVVAFIAFDANDARVGQFFDLLTVREPEPPPVTDGTPIDFLVAQQQSSGAGAGLLETWQVPASDPLVDQLADRAYTYDQAVGAMALLLAGRPDEARQILEALEALEAGTGRLGFLYSTGPLGSDFPAVFTGTSAWVGMAALLYEQSTGDARFRPMARRIADTILSFADPATGLFRGGVNAEGNAYSWISTEHNVDVFFFLRDLGRLTGDDAYAAAADALSRAIMNHLWTGTRFLQGYQDDVIVLDAQALGGLFLLAIGQRDAAETVRAYIEELFPATVQVNGQPVTGYAPYHADAFIWTEGSAMVALLDRRLGNTDSAAAIENALEQFLAPSGGMGYASSRSRTALPGDEGLFPELPQAAATAWFLLQSQNSNRVLAPSAPDVELPKPPRQEVVDPPPVQVPAGGGLEVAVDPGPASAAPGPVTAVFTPVGAGGGSPAQVSRRVAVGPGGRAIFDLSANDLGLLNITPGLYALRFLAFDGWFGRPIADAFFSSLIEFLFG